MKIYTYENTKESKNALAFYRGLGVTRRDIYANADICKSHKDYMIVLDFDEYGKERGLMQRKELLLSSESDFQIGEKVKHKIFGAGEIISKIGENQKIYLVRFEKIEREIYEGFLQRLNA